MVHDDGYVIGYFAVPIVLSVLGMALAVAGLVRTRSPGSGSVLGVLGVLAGLLGSAIAILGIITAL